jgi:hypothetical protein
LKQENIALPGWCNKSKQVFANDLNMILPAGNILPVDNVRVSGTFQATTIACYRLTNFI